MPSRFKKDLARAASTSANQYVVHIDGLEKVLKNIGAENKVSSHDVRTIFAEVGDQATGGTTMPRDTLIRML
jgi:hypothetical protein